VRRYTGLEQYSRKALETVIANFPSREGALAKVEGEENEDLRSDSRDCASVDTASTGK
jgi:hypothetical protein